MGAQTFEQVGGGKSAQEAFLAAREQAAYENGHSGYTGTLAEKPDFVMISVPADFNPGEAWKWAKTREAKYVAKLIEEGDERIRDKWGPAGCIDLGAGSYLFFGWASP